MFSGVPAHEFFREVSRALAAMMTVISLLAACNLRGLDPKVRDAAKSLHQVVDRQKRSSSVFDLFAWRLLAPGLLPL